MAQKFYAVKQGKTPGIYNSWADCKAQVEGFSGAVFKSFQTVAEAMAFLNGGQDNGHVPDDKGKKRSVAVPVIPETGELVAYVDGSYHNGTGEFSYGAVLLAGTEEIYLSEKMKDPELAAMRNVAGEIKGAEAAMRYAVEHGFLAVTIVHDYEGIARWCLGEWKANKAGTQAYKEYYDSIKGKIRVQFQKVKGHSGDRYNDLADHLAKKALGIA